MTEPDLLRALYPVVRVFQDLDIPYYVGGSLASSVYGIARATIDIDLVAEIQLHHIDSLTNNLRDRYYIDKVMIAEAIAHSSSFNLIHLDTSMKIDVFIPDAGDYSRTAMGRRRLDALKTVDAPGDLFVCSTEDIILHKLKWYVSGGEISERQWLDVLGVIKVQAVLLDKEYLEYWSRRLGVLALLKRAFQESGVEL